MLEQLDKPQHVIRLCEYALEIIQKAATSAGAKGLLDFTADPQLTSLLCSSRLMSCEAGDLRRLIKK